MPPATLAPHPTIAYHTARRRFDHRLQALDALHRYLGPTPGHCPRCHERVVIVGGDHWPDALAIEPVPVLEQYPCPLCSQVERMGHQRGRVCHRCRGTRLLGEPIAGLEGIAIDPDGFARRVVGERLPGEALHRIHRCL